jgi:exonuclease III
MRVISWNLAGHGAKAGKHGSTLAARRPDIVALQEVLPSSVPSLLQLLAQVGGLYHSVVSTLPAIPSRRLTHQLTVSRHPVANLRNTTVPTEGPEWLLSSVMTVCGHDLELHNVHVPPGSSNGWLKVTVLRDIYQKLGKQTDVPRILCGDLNTPQAELSNGEVITWGQRLRVSGHWEVKHRIRGGDGREWDAAERAVLTGLAQFDLEDCFRTLHGYGRQEYSWYFRGRGKQIGRRFDHVFASRQLCVHRCEYLHDPRISGFSDHSPIETDFDWPSDPTA